MLNYMFIGYQVIVFPSFKVVRDHAKVFPVYKPVALK